MSLLSTSMRSIRFFDAPQGDPSELESIMGRAKFYEMNRKHTKALDCLNQVSG